LIALNGSNSGYMSLVSPSIGFEAPNFRLGFIDTSSGRVLFQSEEQTNVGGSETKGELLPGSIFDTFKNLAYLDGAGSFGHGPNDLFELPAQTEVPMNGTFRVLAQPDFYNPGGEPTAAISFRVFVSFVGYKILES